MWSVLILLCAAIPPLPGGFCKGLFILGQTVVDSCMDAQCVQELCSPFPPSPPISTLLLHACARAGHRCSSCPHLEHKPTTSQRTGQGEDNSYGPFSASRGLSTCSFKVCFTRHARNSGSSFWGGVAPHHSQNRHNLNTYGW